MTIASGSYDLCGEMLHTGDNSPHRGTTVARSGVELMSGPHGLSPDTIE